ncbi:MAG TPA: hypothetical protein VLC09_05990, partial [Polyangiaceae bacterium]|nr:hypothetical protein [Polyangiaceae bacterium]
VYKATYAGLLKLLIDVVPPDALADKAVIGIATGRTDAHFPLVEESFARLFSAFRGARQLPSLIVSDYQFLAGGGLESGAEAAFQRTFEALLSSSASRPWPRAVNG